MSNKIDRFFRIIVLMLMIVSQPFATIAAAKGGTDFVKQTGPE